MMLSDAVRPHTSGGVAQFHLSRLVFPTRPRSIHRAVMAAFPDGGDCARAEWQILYRLEPDGSVLVQSAIPGTWGNILPASQYQQRVITHEPSEGQTYLFRMAINPVVQRNGRRRSVTADEWLNHRNIGAVLDIDAITYATHHDQSSSGHRVATDVATVSGQLTPTDCRRLIEVLSHGIGRGRAYGCGLVSIVANS